MDRQEGFWRGFLHIDGVNILFLTALKNVREVETREMMVLGMGTFDADIIVFVVDL